MPPRSRQVDCSLRKDQDRLLYAQLSKQASRDTQRLQPYRDSPAGHHQGTSERSATQLQNTRRLSPLSRPVSIYTELGLDSRSRSLPLLDSSSDKEQPSCLSTPAHTPARHSPQPARETVLSDAAPEPALCRPGSSGSSLEQASSAAVYHLAGSPGLRKARLPRQEEVVYTEVPGRPTTLPHRAESSPGMNTYESVEELRPRQKQASWGLKVSTIHISTCMRVHRSYSICFMTLLFLLQNDKWKWPFPEVKRKWWRASAIISLWH